MALRSHPQSKGDGTTTKQNPVVGTPIMYPDGSGTWRPIDYNTINVLSNPKIYDSNGDPILATWLETPHPRILDSNGNSIGTVVGSDGTTHTNQLLVSNGILSVRTTITGTEIYTNVANACLGASAAGSAVQTVTIPFTFMNSFTLPNSLRIKNIRMYGIIDGTSYDLGIAIFRNTALAGTYNSTTNTLYLDTQNDALLYAAPRTRGSYFGTGTAGGMYLFSPDAVLPISLDMLGNQVYKFVVMINQVNAYTQAVGRKFIVDIDFMIG